MNSAIECLMIIYIGCLAFFLYIEKEPKGGLSYLYSNGHYQCDSAQT